MTESVIVALIGVIGLLVTGIASITAAVIAARALAQTKETHTLINSRMDELLRQARALSRAEGIAAGEQSQRDRSAAPE